MAVNLRNANLTTVGRETGRRKEAGRREREFPLQPIQGASKRQR